MGKARRRRRTWYRSRLRRRRAVAIAILVAIVGVVCGLNAPRIFSSFRFDSAADALWPRPDYFKDLGLAPIHGKWRPKSMPRIADVYPYSVVPGGVKNPGALRDVVARDQAVARHYSGFDYSKVRLVRLSEAREVYMSYRIRDTIFWTRKKIHLAAGEMILTDGKIMARAKCGNQISATAKPEVSDEEPEESVMEQPVALAPLSPPLPLRPGPMLPELPVGQPVNPPGIGGFIFPIVPVGGLPPIGVCKHDEGGGDDIARPCHIHHKKSVIPEPASLVLLASGLGLMGWRCRAALRHRATA